MSKLILILSFTFISFSIAGQGYFEGSIEYAYQVKVKSKKIDSNRLQLAIGKGSTLFFKEGNFRHHYNGGMLEFDLYNRRENRFYMKKRDTDTIYWYDCSRGGESIKSLRQSTQTKKVLDIVCNQLTIQYPSHNKVEYYNADSIRVDPEWFAQYKRDDQFKVDMIEKSIFLRSETDYPAFSVVTQATKIKKEVLTTDVFEVPSGALLLKTE